jgi:surfactin synthase thioesterase subunit
MVNRWIVFGGWAMPPQVLNPIFGHRSVCIDTNMLMPFLIRDNVLIKDWLNKLADRITEQIPERPFGIAGWSTGAILACALAYIIEPECGVFISATPSFCRRPGFPHGWKPSVLKAMREQLVSAPEQLMKDLDMQCGIDPASPVFEEKRGTLLYNATTLTAGLFFLEQTTLLPVKKLPCPALFLHGKSDTIIPPAAGKYFSNEGGGTFAEFEGPHAFFVNHHKQFLELIKNI